MRVLRKMNRGFLALLIVLLAIFIYSIALHQRRQDDKPLLQTMTQDYITTALDCVFLPEEQVRSYLTSNTTIEEFTKSESYRTHYQRTKSIYAAFYPDDGKYLDFAMKRLEQKWMNQLQRELIPNFNYTLNEFIDMTFIDDQVSVTISMHYSINAEEEKSNMTKNEQITFIKINGDWKVLIGDLDPSGYNHTWYF